VRLVAFTHGSSEAKTGALLEGGKSVLDLSGPAAALPHPRCANDVFDLDGAFLREARSLVARCAEAGELARLRTAGAVLAREAVALLAPVPRPGKVLCIGLNYKDHAAESNSPLPARPLLFSKFPTCVLAPGGTIRTPSGCENLDYEAELGVVIGKRATRVPAAGAMEHVLGYVNFNDVSARDFQFADGQWQRGKSPDTFGPLGPFVATTDEVADPHKLRIAFRLNGKTLQDSNTDQLHFGVPELVAKLSESVTLEPGDVIATGTPPGVGFARKPPIWVRAGDVMEVEIEGLGVLRNPVVG
jgi:2-keto-4-pentenoate hydratase/2-oxohepta-3-ene-1,7-dioic acid hydratase in catechol pathway